jgi:leucyl/phenylalanyl-tRNA--protein transferase
VRGSIVWLSERDSPDAFPPVRLALREPDGLLAAGGDLSPQRLIAAYRRGIFPWYSQGQPILWWCPDPRAVLIPSEFKTSRSLAKNMRNRGFVTRVDTAFDAVIGACGSAEVRPGGTWLSAEMRAAYINLHELGYAHSFETWLDGQLVGGLYGVAIGHVFFGESMFSRERDASKIALRRLCDALTARGFHMIDCQMATPHLLSLGARLIPRGEFVTQLQTHAVMQSPVGSWAEPSADQTTVDATAGAPATPPTPEV